MNVDAQDFYERLGVPADVEHREIKKAYVQAVRAHPPERYPEKFRRIREAFETLSDPDSRAEYDATSDPRIKKAITAGQEALADEEPATAIKHLKKALVLQPDAHFARNLLGLALNYAGEFEDAREQFVRLTSEVPGNPVYWHNRGYSERMSGRGKEAESSYRHAIQLDPSDSDARTGLANALFELDRKEEAESVLEEAIHADGVIDFDDISYFFELIKLRVAENDIEGIQEVVERIEPLLEEDWQKQRVGYRFAVLAGQLSEVLAFELAERLARQSRKLVPDDEQIAAFADHVLKHHELIEQWGELQESDWIRPGFKVFLAVALRSYFGAFESEEEKESQLTQGFEVLDTVSSLIRTAPDGTKMTVADELDYMEQEFPRIGEILNDPLKMRVRMISSGAVHTAVECPHCGHRARSADKTGRYQCPNCNEAFDYISRTGETKKRSAKVQAEGCVKQAGIWLAWIIGLMLLGALLGG